MFKLFSCLTAIVVAVAAFLWWLGGDRDFYSEIEWEEPAFV